MDKQSPDVLFLFNLWLRDGFRLANVLNKFVLAEWQSTGGLQQFSRVLDQEEVDLMRKLANSSDMSVVSEIVGHLVVGESCPQITDDQLEDMINAFNQYRDKHTYYATIVAQSEEFSQYTDISNQVSSVEFFMDYLWGQLPMITAPSLEMIGVHVEDFDA